MVCKLLDSGVRESSAERRARRLDSVRRTGEKIAAGLGGTVKRLAFERVLAWCEQYYVLRENMRYHADLFLAALRYLALLSAERLVADGALGAEHDVFFLEVDELRAHLLGTGEAPHVLAERAAARRIEQQRCATMDPPECLFGDVEQATALAAGDVPGRNATDGARFVRLDELSGVGVSPGIAEGMVRVVRSLDELQGVEPGEIVVASATDPSWTSMLAVAGAIVLEMGGPLSHGAIVARELAIPAVVNVANATRALATGDRVVVDGGGGSVRRS
jgi:pyruvate,water dikinase